jgi:hypothetical protein
MEYDDYWAEKARARSEEDKQSVAMNPHQFGDQLTLFHAPLNQPEMGVTKGNPNARLYRTVHVPEHLTSAQDVVEYANRPGKDYPHDRNLGIHWQHHLNIAQDHLGHRDEASKYGRHGDKGTPVILEADHPGLEHIVDATPHDGPPKGAVGGSPKNNHLTGYPKDWALIHDTVGPHDMNDAMLAEVPVRPGAPMAVHAVHFPDPTDHNAWVRNPVQFKGIA